MTGYHNTPVLEEISFTMQDPGIYAVLGKNGAGKTTLFRALSGILKPYGGSILIDGKEPSRDPAIRSRIAFLSHLDGFPEGFRVTEIMSLFARIEGVGSDRIDEVNHLLGLEELKEKYVSLLSQGQKKRVAIAKCILGEKDIYMLDEPTSNLDPKAAHEIRSLLKKISENQIVLYSSHNLYEARDISSKVIALSEGRLAMFGNIDSIERDKYVVGIKAEGVSRVYPEARKEGEYYVLELESSDSVQEIIDRLGSAGIRIREIREMDNPLEKFFE